MKNLLENQCLWQIGCPKNSIKVWNAAANETFSVGQWATYFQDIKWILTHANAMWASAWVENEINLYDAVELVGDYVVKHLCETQHFVIGNFYFTASALAFKQALLEVSGY